MTPIPQPNLEDLLLTLRRKIVDMCRREGFSQELTFSQMEIVRFVGAQGRVTMRSIADHLKITPPSATSIVDELEKKGVIDRTPNTDDRRVILISLTAKAQKLYKLAVKHKQTVMQEMIDRLSPEDKKTLERIITILIK